MPHRHPSLRPVLTQAGGHTAIEWFDNNELVAVADDTAPCGVSLQIEGQAGPEPVQFDLGSVRDRRGDLEFGPVSHRGLAVRWTLRPLSPSLVQGTLVLSASTLVKVSPRIGFRPVVAGEFAGFSGPITAPVTIDTVRGAARTETFPTAWIRTERAVYGIATDTPGKWENRCQIAVDPLSRRVTAMAGDARPAYAMVLKPPEDARDTYQYDMDGWQSLGAGEERTFTVWWFAGSTRSHYNAQLVAHCAVASAHGDTGSGVDAILANTSRYLLRRNLARDAENKPRNGRYIFVSGPGYGWKQWVSDGFWTALGLGNPEFTIEANKAVFWTRMDYEDNCHYFLIWAALMRRAGGTFDRELARRAWQFLRNHERGGLYLPPSLPGAPNPYGWKTYHDVLPYEPGDCPTSNQGFHCAAYLAAKEIGLRVSDTDFRAAVAGYRSLFNTERGFFPTSKMQRDTLGQDTLYGATLGYAVFGQRFLTDPQVLAHHRHSERVKSPFGLRVISKADGSLLDGHSGVYCYGGSWFLNDASNYLLAGVHGLPTREVDRLLTERILREIAFTPGFNESISTVDGKPHGHVLYSWKSGDRWLRREVRRRLGQRGPDPVGVAVDRRIGVVREGRHLNVVPVDRGALGA